MLVNLNVNKESQGRQRTLSYPKALVEIREQRRLTNNETVDHNDRNIDNNDSTNLIIRDRRDHVRLDIKRVKPLLMNCILCNKEFELSKNQRHKKLHTAGPFCSKKCSGLYGAKVQNGGTRMKRFPIKNEYYNLKRT